jgi:hypothetical protein
MQKRAVRFCTFAGTSLNEMAPWGPSLGGGYDRHAEMIAPPATMNAPPTMIGSVGRD